jgi:putative chitinase
MITVAALIACGVQPTQARTMEGPLQRACATFDIDSPTRIAAFIGQCAVESGYFTHLEENLYYTTPARLLSIFPSKVTSLQQAMTLVRNPKALANCVYAGKNGNGNPLTGDGWRYKGRGAFQLTGKGNYSDAATETGRPYVTQPELVALPEDACLTAAWYWNCHKLNLLADSWHIDAITKAINGPAMLERDLRRQRSQEALDALTSTPKP